MNRVRMAGIGTALASSPCREFCSFKFACAEYFRRLQERNKPKAKCFRERAEALRELVANEDDDTDGDGDGADDDAEDAAAEMDALVHAANSPDPTEGVGVHDIADDVARIFFKSGRTLRAWAKEFMTNETFALDLRGTACGEHLLGSEDAKSKLSGGWVASAGPNRRSRRDGVS